MRAMPDEEVERVPVNPRRQQLDQKLAVIENRARDLAQRHGRLAAGIALGAAAAALGIGLLFYRRSQKQSVMSRMRSSIPDVSMDLPEELIAQLKSRLQRAAKAL